MVTFGDKSESVLTNRRFCQTAVTPSPSASCFQTFQRVLTQSDHPSSQTTQKERTASCPSPLPTASRVTMAAALQAGDTSSRPCSLVSRKHRHSCRGSVSRPEAQGTCVRKEGGGFTIPYHIHFMELQWLDSQSNFPLLTDAL